jgi:hypothetical protein
MLWMDGSDGFDLVESSFGRFGTLLGTGLEAAGSCFRCCIESSVLSTS